MAFRGAAGATTDPASTTLVINVASIGIQNGDIVILRINAGSSGTLTPAFPAGFAAIPGLANQNLNGSTLSLAYKVASGEPTSYTITPGNSSLFAGDCRVYSGRNTSSPFTAVAATGPNAAQTLPTTYPATGVTAVAGDDVIYLLALEGANGGDTITFTAPSGFANSLTTSLGNIFDPNEFSCDEVNASAGATGTLTASASDTSGKSLQWSAYVISLAAAAATSVHYMNYAFQPMVAQ